MGAMLGAAEDTRMEDVRPRFFWVLELVAMLVLGALLHSLRFRERLVVDLQCANATAEESECSLQGAAEDFESDTCMHSANPGESKCTA